MPAAVVQLRHWGLGAMKKPPPKQGYVLCIHELNSEHGLNTSVNTSSASNYVIGIGLKLIKSDIF